MKKDIKAWAIKIRKRNFFQNNEGIPFVFTTQAIAVSVAMRVRQLDDIDAQPIRVKLRIEEIV